jgi:hypothetical protein
VQWLLDGAKSFSADSSFTLSSTDADARSFGAHESDGTWAVYVGSAPAGILRGVWSKQKRTLDFAGRPELSAAPGPHGFKTQKVTGFADCGGALYVSINTTLYRRNDGTLRPRVPRWSPVYQEPPVGPRNSGLRGVTCVRRHGSPALLVSTEGTGNVYRLDHLPPGQVPGTAPLAPGQTVRGVTLTLEFSPIPAIRRMLEAEGDVIPAAGQGSIRSVIAAYNNFETITLDGLRRQLFGFEWGYDGCPSDRICSTAAHDATACFAIRTDEGRSPSFALRCLSGKSFRPSTVQSNPELNGQAFVSIRTIKLSPFGDERLYFGGFDCNFQPANGTAWIGSAPVSRVTTPRSS